MQCDSMDCENLAVHEVQSLQYLCWQAVAEHSNWLKEEGRRREIATYLRYLPLASHGIGSYQINFAYAKEQPMLDRLVTAHRRFFNNNRYTRLEEPAASLIKFVLQATGVELDSFVFKIVLQGSARTLVRCLLSERTREVKIVSDKFHLVNYCAEHRRKHREDERNAGARQNDEEDEGMEVQQEEPNLAALADSRRNVEIAFCNGHVYLRMP